MTRGYNFGAGPATLPLSILTKAQAEFLDWQGLGMSVCEVGHRTEPFMQLMQTAEDDLRALLAIPNNYHVLFLSMPARTQFAMVPLNLLTDSEEAAFVVSGTWSLMAYQEALHVARAYCLTSSEASAFTKPLILDNITLKADTRYVYYTPNETIQGVYLSETPKFGETAIVADMTSCLLSKPIDIRNYGIIFAGAQKNIAPAGLTLVIIRDDLLATPAPPRLATMLDYRTHVNANSLYATPATFQCYMAALMFKWLKAQGGLGEMQKLNAEKAHKLYAWLDASRHFETRVHPSLRSITNVCFFLKNAEFEAEFLKEAKRRGLHGLKGHRLVGGLRASLYNAMPLAGVDALIVFLDEFEEYLDAHH